MNPSATSSQRDERSAQRPAAHLPQAAHLVCLAPVGQHHAALHHQRLAVLIRGGHPVFGLRTGDVAFHDRVAKLHPTLREHPCAVGQRQGVAHVVHVLVRQVGGGPEEILRPLHAPDSGGSLHAPSKDFPRSLVHHRAVFLLQQGALPTQFAFHEIARETLTVFRQEAVERRRVVRLDADIHLRRGLHVVGHAHLHVLHPGVLAHLNDVAQGGELGRIVLRENPHHAEHRLVLRQGWHAALEHPFQRIPRIGLPQRRVHDKQQLARQSLGIAE